MSSFLDKEVLWKTRNNTGLPTKDETLETIVRNWFRGPCRSNWLITVLNHLVNIKIQNSETKNPVLNHHIYRVLGRLYSFILFGYTYIRFILARLRCIGSNIQLCFLFLSTFIDREILSQIYIQIRYTIVPFYLYRQGYPFSNVYTDKEYSIVPFYPFSNVHIRYILQFLSILYQCTYKVYSIVPFYTLQTEGSFLKYIYRLGIYSIVPFFTLQTGGSFLKYIYR